MSYIKKSQIYDAVVEVPIIKFHRRKDQNQGVRRCNMLEVKIAEWPDCGSLLLDHLQTIYESGFALRLHNGPNITVVMEIDKEVFTDLRL